VASGSPDPAPASAPASAPARDHVTAAQFIKVCAGIVIVAAGLKVASSLLVSIVLAAFIAMVCTRPIAWFKTKGMPSGLAIALVLVLLILLGVGMGALVGGSAAEFTSAVPKYEENLNEIVAGLEARLDELGIDLRGRKEKTAPESKTADDGAEEDAADGDEMEPPPAFDTKRLFELISSVIKGLIGALSDMLMILLLVVFILADAETLPARLRTALGGASADLSRFYEVTQSVNTYLWVKTWISLLTGLCVGIFTAVIGLDFPFLWGFLAFVFNYIPNIGSLIAAIPAVLLGLLQGGWDLALIVGIGFLVINNVIGNVVEPRILGKRMGLTTFVVFLSLLVWSWLWGPIGMLLSVPLTLIVKIALESTPDGKAFAALLGPPEPEESRASGH